MKLRNVMKFIRENEMQVLDTYKGQYIHYVIVKFANKYIKIERELDNNRHILSVDGVNLLECSTQKEIILWFENKINKAKDKAHQAIRDAHTRLEVKIDEVCAMAKDQNVELLRKPQTITECNRLKRVLQGVDYVEDSKLWSKEKIERFTQKLIDIGILAPAPVVDAPAVDAVEVMKVELKEFFEELNSEFDDYKYEVVQGNKEYNKNKIIVTYGNQWEEKECHEVWIGEKTFLYFNHMGLQKYDREIRHDGTIKNILKVMGYDYQKIGA